MNKSETTSQSVYSSVRGGSCRGADGGWGGKRELGVALGRWGAQRDAALERAAPPLLPRAATSLPAAALVAW